ncbi:hypothetical protein ABR737_00950 [Streptomyces sp. Edi2]|uniref:hypothetical protein n=1 Tax=Streptomyces sp. Edi2 TaxID=3162528 RepID=UPI003305B2F3
MTSNIMTRPAPRPIRMGRQAIDPDAAAGSRGDSSRRTPTADEEKALGELVTHLRQDGDDRARRGGRSAARTAQERRNRVDGRLIAVADHLDSHRPADRMAGAALRLIVERLVAPVDVEIFLRLVPPTQGMPRGIYAARLRELAVASTLATA